MLCLMCDVGRDKRHVDGGVVYSPLSSSPSSPRSELEYNRLAYLGDKTPPSTRSYSTLALIADTRQAGTHVPPASHKYIEVYRLQSPLGGAVWLYCKNSGIIFLLLFRTPIRKVDAAWPSKNPYPLSCRGPFLYAPRNPGILLIFIHTDSVDLALK